jgi:hypothetical protein
MATEKSAPRSVVVAKKALNFIMESVYFLMFVVGIISSLNSNSHAGTVTLTGKLQTPTWLSPTR